MKISVAVLFSSELSPMMRKSLIFSGEIVLPMPSFPSSRCGETASEEDDDEEEEESEEEDELVEEEDVE